MTTPPRSASSLLLLCAGFVIWGSAFVWLYAALSIGCAFGWEDAVIGPVSLQRAMLVAVWLAHLVAIGAVLLWARRRRRVLPAGAEPDTFLARATVWTTAVALGVTILNFVPVLLPSACL
ncbi:hypothetical protein [Aureimonas sp. ME7]|uniref:hypothetical protein n=1 Tax=Aureimonas sp. ME7 TaxID=2744252 RepID=UPI0015F605D6|nr:hypothetical protein [Aureimonas sp. ME7]